MIELHLKIFGATLDLIISVPNVKVPKSANQTPIDVEIKTQEKINFSDEEESEENAPIALTSIQNQAKQFEEELKSLGIYDIPNTSDLAPTFEIQDDVEIITNEFEKEQQDMIKDRRR